MRELVKFGLAAVTDVLVVGRVILAQRRITGFRHYDCCPRFEGEKHARYCKGEK